MKDQDSKSSEQQVVAPAQAAQTESSPLDAHLQKIKEIIDRANQADVSFTI